MFRKKPHPVFLGLGLLLVFLCLILVGSPVIILITAPPPTATSQPTPTPTPFPEKGPPTIRGWEEGKVESVCLKAELSFPQIIGKIPEPIDETTRKILTRLGLQVVANGSPCEATLTLTLSGEAFKAYYVPGGTCYTGGKVDGQIQLTSDGQPPLNFPITANKPVPESIWVDWCQARRQPVDYPFKDLWFEPLTDDLSRIWGPQVLVYVLDEDVDQHWQTSVSRRLSMIGPENEIVFALIYALEDEDENLREGAVRQIGEFAPRAEEAIPFVTMALDDEDWEVRMCAAEALGKFGLKAKDTLPALIQTLNDSDSNVGYVAHEALKQITGEDFGYDTSAWQRWWEKQQ
jgi:hypothetical protein